MANRRAEAHGCPRCRIVPPRREDLPLTCVRWLFERSHEDFALYRCTFCAQMYLYQLDETIDWTGTGEDRIWCSWTPITAAEHEEIDRAFLGRTAEREELGLLHDMVHRRRRLVQHPDGRFDWSEAGT